MVNTVNVTITELGGDTSAALLLWDLLTPCQGDLLMLFLLMLLFLFLLLFLLLLPLQVWSVTGSVLMFWQ